MYVVRVSSVKYGNCRRARHVTSASRSASIKARHHVAENVIRDGELLNAIYRLNTRKL